MNIGIPWFTGSMSGMSCGRCFDGALVCVQVQDAIQAQKKAEEVRRVVSLPKACNLYVQLGKSMAVGWLSELEVSIDHLNIFVVRILGKPA